MRMGCVRSGPKLTQRICARYSNEVKYLELQPSIEGVKGAMRTLFSVQVLLMMFDDGKQRVQGWLGWTAERGGGWGPH